MASSDRMSKSVNQGLSYRSLRELERKLHVFLVHPQDGLHVNPTDRQRFGIVNGVEGQEEYYIGEITSQGRWFNNEELIAKVNERLPKRQKR